VIQQSTRRSRLGLASAAVIALLVLSTGSVFADTTPAPGGDVKFSQNGKSADAGAGACESNGDDTETCTADGISVFAGKMSDSISGVTHANQVCAYHETYTYSEITGDYVDEPVSEYGCTVDLPAGVLVFGSKLSTVTLRSTTVTLQQFVCDEYTCEPGSSRNVTVAGTWTGFGPTFSGKYRSSGDDGICRYADSGSGSSREATFAGSIGGVSLGADAYGAINDGKSTYRSRCIEV
jgi:hypothetical protein